MSTGQHVSAIDNRPVATYPGDTTDTVGQLVGPTLAGETLVVDEAVYDEATRTTRCQFRYAAQGDIPGSQS
jgi:hypothetical protein